MVEEIELLEKEGFLTSFRGLVCCGTAHDACSDDYDVEVFAGQFFHLALGFGCFVLAKKTEQRLVYKWVVCYQSSVFGEM